MPNQSQMKRKRMLEFLKKINDRRRVYSKEILAEAKGAVGETV